MKTSCKQSVRRPGQSHKMGKLTQPKNPRLPEPLIVEIGGLS